MPDRTLLDLTVSDPTRVGLPRDRDALRAAIEDPLGLDAPLDAPSRARGAIAEDLEARRVAVDPERIALAASRAQAYSLLLTTLCEPHDELVVPAPVPPELVALAPIAGVHLAIVPWDRSGLDAAAIYDAIGERTRAIVIASPSVPTGAMLDPETAEALGALGVPLICDESLARHPLEAPGDRIASVLARPAETLTFVLDDLAHAAALPEAKLAWIVARGPGSERALARLEHLEATLETVSAAVQCAVPALLALAPPARALIDERVRRNLAALRERTRGTAIEIPRIDGGWHACLALPRDRSDAEWARALLETEGPAVRVHPGSLWSLDGGGASWLVISLVVPPPVFDAGLDAILRCVDQAARRAR